MSKFTQKYTIVQLIEHLDEGVEYPSSNWPLHTTIADTFAVDLDRGLVEKLTELLSRQTPFTVIAGDDDYFGDEQQTRVTMLCMDSKLTSLHYEVIGLLKDSGAVFNNPQFNEDGYKAHATVQSNMRLYKGDIVTFDSLSLIDIFPDHDPYKRKIIKTTGLG